jgi:hypothetical protein
VDGFGPRTVTQASLRKDSKCRGQSAMLIMADNEIVELPFHVV